MSSHGHGPNARAIWRTLAAKPDTWWSSAQLRDHLGLLISASEIGGILRAFAVKGYVRRSSTHGRIHSYAVTDKCTPLPGESIKPPRAFAVPARAMPRQCDLLRAPIYQPAAVQAARAGADDHKRHASHGVRC
jgi:hypothetical protein